MEVILYKQYLEDISTSDNSLLLFKEVLKKKRNRNLTIYDFYITPDFLHSYINYLDDYYKKSVLGNDQDLFITILGNVGSGKSSIALSILKYFYENYPQINKRFSDFVDYLNNILIYTPLDFRRYLKKYGTEKYIPIWIDEAEKLFSKRKSMTAISKKLYDYFAVSRVYQKINIVCNPVEIDKNLFFRANNYLITNKIKHIEDARICACIGKKSIFDRQALLDFIQTTYMNAVYLYPMQLEALSIYFSIMVGGKEPPARSFYNKVKHMTSKILKFFSNPKYLLAINMVIANLEIVGDLPKNGYIHTKKDYEEYLKIKLEHNKQYISKIFDDTAEKIKFLCKSFLELFFSGKEAKLGISEEFGVHRITIPAEEFEQEFIKYIKSMGFDHILDSAIEYLRDNIININLKLYISMSSIKIDVLYNQKNDMYYIFIKEIE